MADKITFDDAFKEDKTAPKADRITFDDALKSMDLNPPPEAGRVFQRLPEEAKPATNFNFGASLKAGLVEDETTKRRLIAESLFPNDPKGIDRVGFVGGTPAYLDDNGELRKVSPGLARFGAGVIANAPEAIGGGIGAMAGPIGAALGAVGAKGLKRAAAGVAFGEPQTIKGNMMGLGGEALLNLATGGTAKGGTTFLDRGKTVDFGPTNMRAAEQTVQGVKRTTGIDLDLAQASGDRKLIALRAYAARYPGKSAEIIQAGDEAAQGQFEAATNRVLDMIATGKPSEVAGQNGVNAAQMAIAQARRQVSDAVRPLYDAAYEAVPVVDSPRILSFLQLPRFQKAFSAGQEMFALERGAPVRAKTSNTEILTQRNADGSYVRNTNRVDSTLTDAQRVTRSQTAGNTEQLGDGLTRTTRADSTQSSITRPSLRELDYTKRALDREIEGLREAGQLQKARALQTQRNQFVEQLDALPNQQWQMARQQYGALASGTIEPLEQGVVGVLARIKNPKLATAAAKIFSDPNVTPTQILEARAAIAAQSPNAWNDLTRQWLGQKFNRALKETQTGDVTNVAGKFRQAVFGTPDDRAKMTAILPGGAAQAFDDLMVAAERLASTPIAGSNTMRDTEIKDQLKGTGAVIFKWLTSPRQAVTDAAEQRALENGTTQIAEALLNPQKRAQLRQVVKMAPSTRQAIMLTTILGGQVPARVAASSGDTPPPALMSNQRSVVEQQRNRLLPTAGGQ